MCVRDWSSEASLISVIEEAEIGNVFFSPSSPRVHTHEIELRTHCMSHFEHTKRLQFRNLVRCSLSLSRLGIQSCFYFTFLRLEMCSPAHKNENWILFHSRLNTNIMCRFSSSILVVQHGNNHRRHFAMISNSVPTCVSSRYMRESNASLFATGDMKPPCAWHRANFFFLLREFK